MQILPACQSGMAAAGATCAKSDKRVAKMKFAIIEGASVVHSDITNGHKMILILGVLLQDFSDDDTRSSYIQRKISISVSYEDFFSN